jgi:hypothetical protein
MHPEAGRHGTEGARTMSEPILTPLSALAAQHGYDNPRSLRRRLDRLGVESAGRQPGRAGESLYDTARVAAALNGRSDTRRSRTRELAAARDQLTRDQCVRIIEALHGTVIDALWEQDAPASLAGELLEDYGDDEDGPDGRQRDLAELVASWNRVRGIAVVRAAERALDLNRHGTPLDEALKQAGLQ